MTSTNRIIMIGPDTEGKGGISRVVKTWISNGFLDGFKLVYIPTIAGDSRLGKFAFMFKSLIAYAVKICGSCSCIYVHTSSKGSFYRKSIYLLLGIMLRKKIVLHIHPSHFKDFIEGANTIRRTYILFVMRKSHSFVVLSTALQHYLKELFPNKTVYVLRNPIDVGKYHNWKAVTRKSDRILYLGWYVRDKGIYDLVDAVGKLTTNGHRLYLDFYGTKNEGLLRNYVEERGLTDIISVNGWLDETAVVDALYGHSILVLPSYTEGLPNVILEAMATKTPIVSTRVGGLCDLLEDGVNAVVCEPRNPDDLYDKILKCLNDADLRKTITHNAYDLVTNLYDVGVIRKELAKVCSELRV